MALPLRDEVAIRRFPWVTVALIAANVFIFLLIQPSAFQNPPRNDGSLHQVARADDRTEFTFKWGAVACEIETGKPLADHPKGCDIPRGAILPAHKSVYIGLLSAMFLHGSILHIAGNMLFLW